MKGWDKLDERVLSGRLNNGELKLVLHINKAYHQVLFSRCFITFTLILVSTLTSIESKQEPPLRQGLAAQS